MALSGFVVAAGEVLAGLQRFWLLRGGRELLAGVKLHQLPGPDLCGHCILLAAGLAAASALP